MRNEERSLDVASIRILPLAVEDLLVVFVVVQIDRPVKGQQNDLWNLHGNGRERGGRTKRELQKPVNYTERKLRARVLNNLCGDKSPPISVFSLRFRCFFFLRWRL